jgi:F-type H+-transporting ATPase subunit delta
MADVQAAKRYAQAAFGIASDAGAIPQWRSELNDIATVLSESAIAPILADPKVPLERRLALVDRALDVSPLAKNFARLLVSKGRSGDARGAAEAFERMADEHDGIAHATVTTAVELSPDQLGAISSRLSRSLGRDVRARSVVDPSILGGVVVRVGDKLVDGSIRTRLKRLRKELEGVR